MGESKSGEFGQVPDRAAILRASSFLGTWVNAGPAAVLTQQRATGRRLSYRTVTLTFTVEPSAASMVTTATPVDNALAPGLNKALPSSRPWKTSSTSGRSVLVRVFAGSGWLNTIVSPTAASAVVWPGVTMTGAGSPAASDVAAEADEAEGEDDGEFPVPGDPEQPAPSMTAAASTTASAGRGARRITVFTGCPLAGQRSSGIASDPGRKRTAARAGGVPARTERRSLDERGRDLRRGTTLTARSHSVGRRRARCT